MIEIYLRRRTVVLLAAVGIITLSAQVGTGAASIPANPGAPVRTAPAAAATLLAAPAQLHAPPAYLLEWGSYGTGDGQFDTAISVAAHSSGVVYVVDSSATQVQKFNSQGAFLYRWGSAGATEGEFNSPWGVGVDSAGNVYVADGLNRRIQKFDGDGGFLRTWGYGVDDGTNVFQVCTSSCLGGYSGSGAGQLSFPLGLAVDRASNVYVADYGSNRVTKYDSDGNYVTHWGSAGFAEGQFTNGPTGVAVDEDGSVYTTEEGSYRVQVFDSAGTFVRMWGFGVQDGSSELQVCTSSCQGGLQGTGEGQFFSPAGVAVDSHGDIYVVDSAPSNRVQKFDRFGRFLCQWNQGNGSLNNPYGAAIQGSSFYLTDIANNRIIKFGGPYFESFVGEPEQD